MKKYISETLGGASRTFQFDSFEEAKAFADKQQKSRKSQIVVFEKTGEDTEAIYFTAIYNAKGLPINGCTCKIYK